MSTDLNMQEDDLRVDSFMRSFIDSGRGGVVEDAEGYSWYLVQDACERLRLRGRAERYTRFIDAEHKRHFMIETLEGHQRVQAVDLAGLTFLMLKGRCRDAELFRTMVARTAFQFFHWL